MRGLVIVLLMASVAQANPVAQCVPAQRVQKARVVVRNHHAANVQAYVAPHVQQYVEQAVNGHSYSGLEYNYHNLAYQFKVGEALQQRVVADLVYENMVRDGTMAALVAKAVAEAVANTRSGPQENIPVTPATKASANVSQLLKTSCVKCHGGEKPKAGIDLSNPDSVSALVRWKSYNAALTGEMPQGGRPLEDGQVDILREWAASAGE